MVNDRIIVTQSQKSKVFYYDSSAAMFMHCSFFEHRFKDRIMFEIKTNQELKIEQSEPENIGRDMKNRLQELGVKRNELFAGQDKYIGLNVEKLKCIYISML